MEILCLYNTPIKLEEGDLIAYNVKKRLYIRSGDDLYVCCDKTPNLKDRLYVNSAGFYSKNLDAQKLNWEKYIPKTG